MKGEDILAGPCAASAVPDSHIWLPTTGPPSMMRPATPQPALRQIPSPAMALETAL